MRYWKTRMFQLKTHFPSWICIAVIICHIYPRLLQITVDNLFEFVGFCRFTICLTYYGLAMNTGKIGGNIYVNFLVAAIVEALGYISCYLTLDRFGRKAMNIIFLLLCGVALFCSMFVKLFAGKGTYSIYMYWYMIMYARYWKIFHQ